MSEAQPTYAHGPHATQVHGVISYAPVVEAAVAEEATAQQPVAPVPTIEVPASVQPAKPAKKASHLGRRIAWTLAMIAIGVVVGLIIVAYMKFVDGSVSGKVTDTLQDERQSVAATPAPPSRLGGLAIEFAYPGIFEVVAQVKTDKNATEQYVISSRSDYSRTIAVSVRPLESSDISNDSSYRVRQNDPSTYKETHTSAGADPIYMMTKVDKTEQTMFWIDKGRVATVSVTSNNPKDDVTKILDMIRTTWTWRK